MSEGEKAIPFGFFVSLISAIAKIKPRKVSQNNSSRSTPYVVQTFRNWVAELHRRYAPLPPGTAAIVFRLLFPEEDVRRKYGLQETRLAQSISKVLGISKNTGARGNGLVNWDGDNSIGCLGLEVQKILEESSTITEGTLSIAKVDALLSELAATCAFSSPSVRRPHSSVADSSALPRPKSNVLRALYTALSPVEAGVVTQIILKDLRPMLYPIPPDQTHYTASLLSYNSNALTQLTKFDAMREWDLSKRMLATYRVRAYLDEAAQLYETLSTADEVDIVLKPLVGVPVQIPKCTKGQGCAQALHVLRTSKKVWAETKYDGERAQIHVEIINGEARITIYSKSGRESTQDRVAIHETILDALGIGTTCCKVKTNAILEAEMVAFSDSLDRVDEFWRIRSIIASTAVGPRRVKGKEATHEEDEEQEDIHSQSSIISDASDGGTRRLALVFFDVLFLDDQSLLPVPYSRRRVVLESIINTAPGHAMLAERTPISLTCQSDGNAQLRTIFSGLIADHQEGVVLKADESRYNDWRLPWVKLKKDYIPGYGDCLDLVIVGAAWDKERGRELRVAPTVYTTFYLGALANGKSLQMDRRAVPHFEVFFTVSYGLAREQLEELNFIIKSTEPVKYISGRRTHGLSYTIDLFSGISAPTVLLGQPLLAEVYGACFSKAPGSLFYELRFPRIAKVFRARERSWTEGTSLDGFQRTAHEAIGRDPSNKEIDDWARELFGKPRIPGVKCPTKRKQMEETWMEKLELVDRQLGERKSKKLKTGKESIPEKALGTSKTAREEGAKTGTNTPRTATYLRALGSVTNVAQLPVADVDNASSDSKGNTTTRNVQVAPEGLHPVILEARSPSHKTVSDARSENAGPVQYPPQEQSSHTSVPARSEVPAAPAQQTEGPLTAKLVVREDPMAKISEDRKSPEVPLTPFTLQSSEYDSTAMGKFLRNAVVWMARPQDPTKLLWRVPSKSIIPAGQRVHGLEAFLMACGWCTPSQTNGACAWVERGVVFVDDTDDGSQWMEYPLKVLLSRSMKMLSCEELQAQTSERDIQNRAICRLA
ncbi:uncharacterized protein LAESUDRAFT_115651 [Laetiporus sulphureus 93-53]|uniref:ATP-dependent DNA ligase family profile domain-containing protein n=1 Tax=Laetiporus sulphureus 93-53 TaxID=1314785 RepID=A0A165EQM7_9APHY|nr:uncharacterized protein LAESUDRAFT_115651 [Laetiporus sulphureus 93-53]KZT07561.1 hypothetical protein LAESUDRAFT_115651 [Laetiporus sulphureus 93-53]